MANPDDLVKKAAAEVGFHEGPGPNAGIVEDVFPDGVVCIGGNYSDGVNRENRRGGANTAEGYGRPDWAAPPP